jgi:pimeloyl-ACP methyl ester carboxylesterase
MTKKQPANKSLSHYALIKWGAIVVALLAIAGCCGVVMPSKSDTKEICAYHPFRSEQAKAQFLKLYDARADTWPVPSECRMVGTSFGRTYVRISGPNGAPPLVLLHGGGANSLHWVTNIEALSTTYRTYAVDNIYDFGRSVCSRSIKNVDDFTDWLDELFTALELENHINLVGLSYGGWLAGEYALRFPGRLDKVILLAPAGTVLPLRMAWISRALLCTLPVRYFTRSFMRWLLQDLAQRDEDGRKMVEEWADFTYTAMRSFAPRRMLIPTVFSDTELQGIKLPILYLVGEHEKMYPARKALERLHRVAPQIKTEIIPGAGHDLTIVQAEMLNRKVLDFLNQGNAQEIN